MFEGQQIGTATGNYVAPSYNYTYNPTSNQYQTGTSYNTYSPPPILTPQTPITASNSPGPSTQYPPGGYSSPSSSPKSSSSRSSTKNTDQSYTTYVPYNDYMYAAPATPSGNLYNIGIGTQDQIAIQQVGNQIKQFGGGYAYSPTNPGIVYTSQNGVYDNSGIPITTGYPGVGLSGVVAKSTGVWGSPTYAPSLAGYVGATNLYGGAANTLYTAGGPVITGATSFAGAPPLAYQVPNGAPTLQGTITKSSGSGGIPKSSGGAPTVVNTFNPTNKFKPTNTFNPVLALVQAPNWIAPNSINPRLDTLESARAPYTAAAPGEYTFADYGIPSGEGLGVSMVDDPSRTMETPQGIRVQLPQENRPVPFNQMSPAEQLQQASGDVNQEAPRGAQGFYDDPFLQAQAGMAGMAGNQASIYQNQYNRNLPPLPPGYRYQAPPAPAPGTLGGPAVGTTTPAGPEIKKDWSPGGMLRRFSYGADADQQRNYTARLRAWQESRDKTGQLARGWAEIANSALNNAGQQSSANNREVYNQLSQDVRKFYEQGGKVTPNQLDDAGRHLYEDFRPGPARSAMADRLNQLYGTAGTEHDFHQYDSVVSDKAESQQTGREYRNEQLERKNQLDADTYEAQRDKIKANSKEAQEKAKQAGLRSHVLAGSADQIIKYNRLRNEKIEIDKKAAEAKQSNMPAEQQRKIQKEQRAQDEQLRKERNALKTTLKGKLDKYNGYLNIMNNTTSDSPEYKAAKNAMDTMFGEEEQEIATDPRTGQAMRDPATGRELIRGTGRRPGLQDVVDQLNKIQGDEQNALQQKSAAPNSTEPIRAAGGKIVDPVTGLPVVNPSKAKLGGPGSYAVNKVYDAAAGVGNAIKGALHISKGTPQWESLKDKAMLAAQGGQARPVTAEDRKTAAQIMQRWINQGQVDPMYDLPIRGVEMPQPIQQPGAQPEWGNYAIPGEKWRTDLSPAEEAAFQNWVRRNHIPNGDSPTSDYDMRGYWKNVASQGRNQTEINKLDRKRHFPDTYKTPYHETFSRESQYALPTAGHWEGAKGREHFVPPSTEEPIDAEGVTEPVYGKITPMRPQSRFPITDAVARILAAPTRRR